jgi:hypothetical protein
MKRLLATQVQVPTAPPRHTIREFELRIGPVYVLTFGHPVPRAEERAG